MSTSTTKTRESVTQFFGNTKLGLAVFALGMLLAFGVGGGGLVSLVQ